MLKKHQVVMRLETSTRKLQPDVVNFRCEQTGERLGLHRRLRENMETPERITVTVEPGNTIDD